MKKERFHYISLKNHNIVNFMHENTYKAYTTENNFKMHGVLTSLYHKLVSTVTNTAVKCTYGTG